MSLNSLWPFEKVLPISNNNINKATPFKIIFSSRNCLYVHLTIYTGLSKQIIRIHETINFSTCFPHREKVTATTREF